MIDFDQVFSDFCAKPQGTGNIAGQVYDILPTLSKAERQTLDILNFYADEYDLPEVRKFTEHYMKVSAKNRNLGFFEQGSVKNLLKAMTLSEMIPQVGVSTSSSRTGDK